MKVSIDTPEIAIAPREDAILGAVKHKHTNKSIYFGNNTATKEVLEYAHIAANTSNIILLLGETGTGKGLLAKWIHDHNKRSDKPFVEVNCSSLKGDLLRSELFGHVRGSFTSAIRDKDGLLDAADGGTLFLDEIGDMDIEVQAQLLKTIEEKSFRRVGDTAIRHSDFRLICATNHDLLECERFRRDLYYRISVFPITLTPLRDKKDEIPGLCMHMLTRLGYYHSLSENVINLLCCHDWPGNARELRNILERALMLSQNRLLTEKHFPNLKHLRGIKSPVSLTPVLSIPLMIPAPSKKLKDVERAHVLRIMEECYNDVSKASKVLGISSVSLYRRLYEIKNGHGYPKKVFSGGIKCIG
jgi:transcriptional regulator with PAS, ATPase and Fis domain